MEFLQLHSIYYIYLWYWRIPLFMCVWGLYKPEIVIFISTSQITRFDLQCEPRRVTRADGEIVDHHCLILFISIPITFWRQIVVCPFFGYCFFCPLIYGFWLPLWYLQTLLVNISFKSVVDGMEVEILTGHLYTSLYWMDQIFNLEISQCSLDLLQVHFLYLLTCHYRLHVE
jgi:hypothetical protein